MGLVAANDLAVAAASATFAFSEVRVGVSPATIAVPAMAVMSRRAFARHALTGDTFGAEEAVAAGLLMAAAGDPAAMDEWVTGTVVSLLRASPAAVTATKGLLGLLAALPWDEAPASAETLSNELFASSSGAEGMAAFLGKRSPTWLTEWPPR